MSHKRSKWKFSPARKRRPSVRQYSGYVPEEEFEPQIVEEDTAEEAAVPEPETPAAEAAEAAAPEPEIPAVEAAAPEPEMPAAEPAVTEEYELRLPDYFFDEEDEDEEEPEEEKQPESNAEPEFELEPEDELEPEFEEETEFGEELSEDYFDAEDTADEEPRPSLYEWGLTGKKRGKKKGSGKNKKSKKKESAVKSVRIGDLIVGDGMPKICVPITGRSKEEILKQASEVAAAAPDLAEWRVDYLEEAGGKKDIVDILVALKRILRDIPLLFTYRTEGEGGNGRVGWSHYAELLEWASCRPEIDAIDVEAMGLDVDTEGLIRVIRGRGTPVISSVHYFGEMPGKKERKEAIRFLKQSGGDIIKIAVTPQNKEDVLDFMKWTWKQSRKTEQPLITMAMGDLGKVSRISGILTGSAITFGSVGEASAPGQIPAAELRTILKQM